MKNYFGHVFYGIETNLFGELVLNGEVLTENQELIVLRCDKKCLLFESTETVLFVLLEGRPEKTWELLIHDRHEDYFSTMPMRYLYARLKD